MPENKTVNGVPTSKIYNYLGAGKHILGLVPKDGIAAKIISETGSGTIASSEDPKEIADVLEHMYSLWENNTLKVDPNRDISIYEWRNLTKRLVAVFDSLIG